MFSAASLLHALAWICVGIALIGSAYQLLAAAAVRWLSAHRRQAPIALQPVTILKPLCGDEPRLYENLKTFCIQDYPLFQLVFGVRNFADPAVHAVNRLKAEFPALDIRLVVNDALHGTNNKVSNLINMMADATHEILVLADSDMIVRPDYLRVVVGTLQTPGTGLATCLYTGDPMPDCFSAIGAAGINFWFLPSAAVSKLLGGKIGCYGATIAIRRETLDTIGGFAALKDQLADDYALGALVRASGLNVIVAPYFPATLVDERNRQTLLAHELRWARTIRNTEPVGYAGSAVTHPIPFALLAAALGSVAGLPWPVVLGTLAIAAACRVFLVGHVSRAFQVAFPAWWVLLIRDVLSLLILVTAYLGRSVSWRNSAFRVDRVGALFPESDGI